MRRWTGKKGPAESLSTGSLKATVVSQSDHPLGPEACCCSAPGEERAGEACQAVAGIGRWMAHACMMAVVGQSGPFEPEALPRSESEHISSPISIV